MLYYVINKNKQNYIILFKNVNRLKMKMYLQKRQIKSDNYNYFYPQNTLGTFILT